MLVQLNVWNAQCATCRRGRSTASASVRGSASGVWFPSIMWLLFRGFWWRLGQKYVIRDFHPLVFFYARAVSAVGLGLGIYQTVIKDEGYARRPA